jgi:hypothetical protein
MPMFKIWCVIEMQPGEGEEDYEPFDVSMPVPVGVFDDSAEVAAAFADLTGEAPEWIEEVDDVQTETV